MHGYFVLPLKSLQFPEIPTIGYLTETTHVHKTLNSATHLISFLSLLQLSQSTVISPASHCSWALKFPLDVTFCVSDQRIFFHLGLNIPLAISSVS